MVGERGRGEVVGGAVLQVARGVDRGGDARRVADRFAEVGGREDAQRFEALDWRLVLVRSRRLEAPEAVVGEHRALDERFGEESVGSGRQAPAQIRRRDLLRAPARERRRDARALRG